MDLHLVERLVEYQEKKSHRVQNITVDHQGELIDLCTLVSKYVDWSSVDNIDMSMKFQKGIAEFWDTWWATH